MGLDPLLFKGKIKTAAVPAKQEVIPPAKANPLMAMHKQDVSEAEIVSEQVEIAQTGVEKAEGPMNFQDRLNELDRLIQLDAKIGEFTFDAVRGHVKQVMIDLKTQPELDSCLIDRDVHNIIAFIRSVKQDATKVIETTKVKRVAKSKKGKPSFDFDLSKMPAGLGGLGKLDI